MKLFRNISRMMFSYSGYHGTINVTHMCNSMKSGAWSPRKKECDCRKRENNGRNLMKGNFEKKLKVLMRHERGKANII
jgi:hypothetical protein